MIPMYCTLCDTPADFQWCAYSKRRLQKKTNSFLQLVRLIGKRAYAFLQLIWDCTTCEIEMDSEQPAATGGEDAASEP